MHWPLPSHQPTRDREATNQRGPTFLASLGASPDGRGPPKRHWEECGRVWHEPIFLARFLTLIGPRSCTPWHYRRGRRKNQQCLGRGKCTLIMRLFKLFDRGASDGTFPCLDLRMYFKTRSRAMPLICFSVKPTMKQNGMATFLDFFLTARTRTRPRDRGGLRDRLRAGSAPEDSNHLCRHNVSSETISDPPPQSTSSASAETARIAHQISLSLAERGRSPHPKLSRIFVVHFMLVRPERDQDRRHGVS